MFNLYTALLTAGVDPTDIDHHESDLYVRSTPVSDALVQAYQDDAIEEGCSASLVKTFMNRLSPGEMWWEVAFAFNPFWDKCLQCAARRKEETPPEDYPEQYHMAPEDWIDNPAFV
jgi:hypothetical protein